MVSQPLFVQALNFVIFMAFVMLTIEQNIQKISPVTFFCFVAFSTQTLTNFVTYRTAEAFTEKSIQFAHIIQRSLWYRLPVSHQKKLIFTIERAEKSFLLKGSAIFQVNMEVFANVSEFFFNLHDRKLYQNITFVVLQGVVYVLFDVKAIETEGLKKYKKENGKLNPFRNMTYIIRKKNNNSCLKFQKKHLT